MSRQLNDGTATAELARDYMFDNMRAVLIILVVWGHVLTSMISHGMAVKVIYYFIFFFHMPAMTFISGYFSKNLDKCRNNSFDTIFLPYVFLNIANYLFKIYIMQEDYFQFRVFRPYWGLWYLFALFIWKFFLKDLVRIRFILPICFLVALMSGFSREFSDYMSLGRIIGFLPFFLLGYYCTAEHIERIRRLPKMISMLIIAATGVLSLFIVKNSIMKSSMLFLRDPYVRGKRLESMGLRFIIYITAIAMIIAVINLMTSKKIFLSKLGSNTMTVYILHLFLIPKLEEFHILEDSPYLYIIYSIVVTAFIVFLFSREIVKRVYDKVMDTLVGLVLKKKV